MSVTQGDFYDTGIQKLVPRYDKNVSILEVNMLKNSSTLAVSVRINLSIKLGFVCVNRPRETYFVDVPRVCVYNNAIVIKARIFVLCVPMPTHCTIMCFGFRARQIEGIECGLFSTHAPLGPDHITYGTTICTVYWRKLRLG